MSKYFASLTVVLLSISASGKSPEAYNCVCQAGNKKEETRLAPEDCLAKASVLAAAWKVDRVDCKTSDGPMSVITPGMAKASAPAQKNPASTAKPASAAPARAAASVPAEKGLGLGAMFRSNAVNVSGLRSNGLIDAGPPMQETKAQQRSVFKGKQAPVLQVTTTGPQEKLKNVLIDLEPKKYDKGSAQHIKREFDSHFTPKSARNGTMESFSPAVASQMKGYCARVPASLRCQVWYWEESGFRLVKLEVVTAKGNRILKALEYNRK